MCWLAVPVYHARVRSLTVVLVLAPLFAPVVLTNTPTFTIFQTLHSSALNAKYNYNTARHAQARLFAPPVLIVATTSIAANV